MNVTRARASALLAAATLGASPGRARAQTDVLRIGTSATEVAAQVYYAQDLGLFAKAGIDAEIEAMQNTGFTSAAVSSGAIDVGHATVETLADAHRRHVPLVVIAAGAEYVSPATRGIAAILVPLGSSVRQAKDLNGKSVAVVNLGAIAPRAWVDRNGGDASTLRLVEMPFAAMPTALAAGRVDAAFVAEPFLDSAEKSARILAYAYDGIGKEFLLGVWFSAPGWAAAHGDLVRRFAAVMRETAVWANANPAQSGTLLAKDLKMDPAVVAKMTRVRYAETLTAALMQPAIDASARYGGYAPFPAQELLFAPSQR